MFFNIDLNQDRSGISNYISATLLDEIENTLKKWEKVLLYLNKRGSFSSLICEDCHYLFECPNCDTSLSIHSNPEHLRCHICNHCFNVPLYCKNCNGNKLKSVWVGTQQIEKVLREYFNSSSYSQTDTSLNLSCQERKDKNKNVVWNYYETPEYIKQLVKKLRATHTPAEEILWEIFRAKRFHNLKFRRQHPFGRYIADFYCDELKLVIELDGKIHEKTKEYDYIRDQIISQYGVQILRIPNQEIENSIGIALEKIESAFALSPSRRELERGVQKKVTIYRFDSDALKTISSKKEAVKDLEAADIIIGTKMLTTGFDFEGVWLIWILLVEWELSYPSFDAEEKAYSNLKQLIGRWNRKSQETNIILQSFIPKNDLVKQITQSNFKDFFTSTLKERKDFLYPPFNEMVTLEYRNIDSKKSLSYMEKLEEKLRSSVDIEGYQILRGTSAFKKNNSYHASMIIKGNNIRNFLEPLRNIILRESKLSVIFHDS